MAMKSVVALFDDRRQAVKAVRELIAHGIAKDHISFVSRAADIDVSRVHLPLDDQPENTRAPREGTGQDINVDVSPARTVGATLGIGSVLLGVAFLSLPAVGPVLAAGPLLAGLVVSGAGAASTDLPQRLCDLGMPASDGERYARAIRRGGTLVVLAIGDEDVEDAAMILARHAPIDPDELREPPMGLVSTAAQAWPRPGTASPKTSATSPPRHDHPA